MCGIAGGFALNTGASVDRARIHSMSCAIAHRGPDGEGLWEDARTSFAHRRLAIIDLATGQQPMHGSDERFTVVFNGEIYNYVELREELAAQGITFRTQSDTEVLIRLYERDGTNFVRRLRGMFAVAIRDASRDRLILARDRIGKKPLYYAIEDDCIYFASSFRAVREGLRSTHTTDPAMVSAFLNLGYVPAPRTIDPRVSKLEAGTLAIIEGGRVRLERYWDAADPPEPWQGTWAQAVDRLDEILQTAVHIRLRSDVPLGVFLSGGIDSSLVAAMAARAAGTRILTFCVGFDVARFDESHYAADVAKRIGSEHHAFRAHWDAIGLLPDLVRHFGEPFGDSSAVPIWILARETRRHVTVAVGGDGGDEGFGGYEWYRNAFRLARMQRSLSPQLAAVGSRALAGSRSPRIMRIRRGLHLLAADEAKRFALLRGFMDHAEANRLYAGELADAWRTDNDGSGAMATRFRNTAGSALHRMQVVDIQTYLADCLMPKVDVATMASGLEARAPLLDTELLRFAMSLPDAWITDGSQGKRILRAVAERYLPASLFDRPKQGFDVPFETWFTDQLRSRLEGLPTSEPLRATSWFRPAALQALVREHLARARNHTQRLYNLLVLEEWLRGN